MQEVETLNNEIIQLENKLENNNEQLINYNILTKNLNKLLSTVYYGKAKPVNGGREKNFTAFGMFYNDNYYIITAGHCIKYENIEYTDFKFKSNDNNLWISPKLVYFEADYENKRDFAIFIHHMPRKGLIIDQQDKEPKYVLGNMERKLNLFKEFKKTVEGESGSPILSSGSKLVGIVIKNNDDYTPIEVVIEAIEKYVKQTDEE